MMEIFKHKPTGRSEYEKVMSDAPAFDKEAALAAYKAEHPDAEEDIKKARFMAEAGDKYETMAVNRLKDAERLISETGKTRYRENEVEALPPDGEDYTWQRVKDPRGDEFTKSIKDSDADAINAARQAFSKADEIEYGAGLYYERLQEVKKHRGDDRRH